jgi:hypothetical protein
MFKNFARHGKVVLYRLLIRCIIVKKKKEPSFNTVEKEKRKGADGEGGGEESERYEQPRRPESRAPNGSNALRAYVPARMRAAETFPSASWAFFCVAEAEADADDDEEEDSEVEVENGRRRCGRCVR